MSTAYCVLIRERRDAYNHRLRLGQSARQRGVKPTARLFQTTVPTVRKWLRRLLKRRARALPVIFENGNEVSLSVPSYCSFAYSSLACFRMGMSGSAFFQRVRKS